MRNYSFKEIKEYEMCVSSTLNHKVLSMRMDKSQGGNLKNKYGIAVGVLHCTECNLVYSSPQPISNNIQDHCGILPEKYWKNEYFYWNPEYFKSQIEFAKKTSAFKKGMQLIVYLKMIYTQKISFFLQKNKLTLYSF